MSESAILAMAPVKLIWTEWLMVGVFVIGVVAWGFFMRKTAATLEGSFLAERKVPGLIASLSTVATNLNVNDFIGGAGMMYAAGVIMAHGGWVNGLGLIVVSLFVVQKLRRMNVYTLGEWLEKRYWAPVGVSYSLVWTFVWMLFNLGLYLYGGAFVLEKLVGWDLYGSLVILSIIAASYTLIGGFGAVVATDVLQISLMFFPFVFLAAAVWIDVGGPANVAAALPASHAEFWPSQTRFGPLGIMLGGIFLMGTSYWSTEAQVIQRPLSARSEEDAIVAYLGAAFWLSLLYPILISVPALAAIQYFPNLARPDDAVPCLIRMFLPRGLYGVTVVGLMAGVFSSVDSQINAFCTMFTTDIYQRFIRRGAGERHYLIASKVAGALFTFAAIGTAVLISTREEGMMLFAISVVATIMPPFAAVTLLGALVGGVNRIGATVGLAAGAVVAVAQIVLAQCGRLDEVFAGFGLPDIVTDDTLFLRTVVTFTTTAVLTLAFSLVPDSRRHLVGAPVDLSVRWTRQIGVMVVLLLLGMGAMVAFWTWYF
jgi:SSS family solute:Na+ symporter